MNFLNQILIFNKFYEYYVKYNKFYNKFYTSSTSSTPKLGLSGTPPGNRDIA